MRRLLLHPAGWLLLGLGSAGALSWSTGNAIWVRSIVAGLVVVLMLAVAEKYYRTAAASERKVMAWAAWCLICGSLLLYAFAVGMTVAAGEGARAVAPWLAVSIVPVYVLWRLRPHLGK